MKMVSPTLVAAIAAAQKRLADDAAKRDDKADFLAKFAVMRGQVANAIPPVSAPVEDAVFEEDGETDAPERLPDVPTVPETKRAAKAKKGKRR